MKEDIRKFARLGLVHHMLYPACMKDPDDHVKTLAEFVRRTDIETLDCCIPYGEARRKKIVPAVKKCGKEDVTFATHLFPLRKVSLCTPEPHVQEQIRMIIGDMVGQAAAMGAKGFIFASGGPTPAEATAENRRAFAEFCKWLCGELRPHGITAMLEPFDTTFDKKFLYGPTAQCARVIHESGCDNFGIELDFAHLPLMGETFAEGIAAAGRHLKRVHLGNCMKRDPKHPLYGDSHPPVGYPGGEIDVAEVTVILRGLLEAGFLDQTKRGSLLVEMTPWPGKSVEETVEDSWERLDRAWSGV